MVDLAYILNYNLRYCNDPKYYMDDRKSMDWYPVGYVSEVEVVKPIHRPLILDEVDTVNEKVYNVVKKRLRKIDPSSGKHKIAEL